MKRSFFVVSGIGILLVFGIFYIALNQKFMPLKPTLYTANHITVPNIPLLLFDDPQKNLDTNSLKGKPYIINIFASWCPGCIIEMPELHQLNDQKLLPIIGIAWKDKDEDLAKFLKQYGNPYSQIAKDDKGEMVVALGVMGAPETLLVDAQGRVIYRYPGALDEATMKNVLLPLIKAQAANAN